ncbi:hypothetical protein SAMN02746095_00237 [Acidocella aminolytica 101 = DSM 11237]|nr:hypothetical protein SAMN02746095_00237 [Acidocella aminolytica 101 = DSM 11237]
MIMAGADTVSPRHNLARIRNHPRRTVGAHAVSPSLDHTAIRNAPPCPSVTPIPVTSSTCPALLNCACKLAPTAAEPLELTLTPDYLHRTSQPIQHQTIGLGGIYNRLCQNRPPRDNALGKASSGAVPAIDTWCAGDLVWDLIRAILRKCPILRYILDHRL